MRSNQFFQYFQVLEDNIGTFSDNLFGKYNDSFDNFYLEECDDDVAVDKSRNQLRINGKI